MDYVQYLDTYESYRRILARRAWAAIIDYAVYFVILIVYSYFFGDRWVAETEGASFRIDFKPGNLASILIWFAYFPMMESTFGWTLAKALFDLRVI